MTEMRYIDDSLVGNRYKPGMVFPIKIAVPCCAASEYGLLVEHDGQNDANVSALLRLADEGRAPYCVSIGVYPGSLPMADGSTRGMRMNSYDLFDREYGDFLVYELIPYITEKYGLSISDDPKKHAISGGSSGGISAFVAAWFHPEYFGLVYMSSPSFLAMGRGNEIPYLIRKYETKPLKIYEEISENEPNDYFGWSRAIDEEAREALIFAGYDFTCTFFAGEGHCSRYGNADEAYVRFAWLFGDDGTHRNSPRVNAVIPADSRWETCEEMPDSGACVPMAGYDLALQSNDALAWYCAKHEEDIVYMLPKTEASALGGALLHAALHTIPRIEPKGAIAMAVDRADRLYVLTAIGIQCVRSFGLIDVILDLPDASKPLGIAVTDALYVRTENGVYKRSLCDVCTEDADEKRKFVSYYD